MWHSASVVNIVTLVVGPAWPAGVFLGEVCMFLLCRLGFPLSSLVCSHSPKTCRFRSNVDSKLPIGLNVNVFVYTVCVSPVLNW